MACELLDIVEAELELFNIGVPDEAKFKEFRDSVWWEYHFERINCQGAVAKIRDYGRLKLVK